MAAASILNPEELTPELEAGPLSREILAEARAIDDPGRCTELDRLTAQLHGLAPERIDGDRPRLAFWINLYNALVLHRLCLEPIRGSLLRHLRFFDRVAYRVGGEDYSLNQIEHGLLRSNRRPPYRLRRTMRPSDRRLGSAPGRLDPRIHFALNCGARSCPPIQAYDPDVLDEQLDFASRAYLEAETKIDPDRRRVALPRLMRLYRADFGSRSEQLAFAARHLPAVEELRAREGGEPRIGYARFDWTVAASPGR